MSDEAKHAANPARRTALLVLALGFALNFAGRGLAESFVVFILPLGREFGWARAEVVSIQAIAMLVTGLIAPFVGRLFDRSGPRVVFGLGLGLLGVGLTLAAMAQALWHLQLCVGVGLGLGVACLGNVPNSALLSRWYRDRLTLAVSILFAAAGLGVLVVVPLAQVLVDSAGWRGAYRDMGFGVLLLLMPILLLPWARLAAGDPTGPARSLAQAGGPDLRRAIRQPAFWGLFATFLFTSIGMHGTAVQVVAFLVESGFAPLKAATAWGVSGVLLPLGMLLFGWLDGRIGRRLSVFLSYACSLAGIAALFALGRFPSELLLALSVLLFGSTIGSRGPLITSTAMAIFRGGNAGTIFGTISMGAGLGAGIGTWLSGLLHDWSGGYELGFAVAFVSVFLGMLPFLVVPALRR